MAMAMAPPGGILRRPTVSHHIKFCIWCSCPEGTIIFLQDANLYGLSPPPPPPMPMPMPMPMQLSLAEIFEMSKTKIESLAPKFWPLFWRITALFVRVRGQIRSGRSKLNKFWRVPCHGWERETKAAFYKDISSALPNSRSPALNPTDKGYKIG